jgi:hypothetical protein
VLVEVVVEDVDGSVADVVVVGGNVVDGKVVEGTVDDVVVDDEGTVEAVAAATPVSGDTHPAGGVVGPVCPGISTVPAHPKSEKVASLVLVDPSEKCATERVWRM